MYKPESGYSKSAADLCVRKKTGKLSLFGPLYQHGVLQLSAKRSAARRSG